MNWLSWRQFPAWLIGSLGIVIAVNVYMAYAAVQTFPGEAGADGFDLSNAYNHVLAAEQTQAALGWRLEAAVDPQHHVLLMMTDRAGQILPGLKIDVEAERPVGPADHVALALRDLGQGRMQSDTTLFSGQWNLLVTARSSNDVYSTTRRVVVR